MRLISFLLIGVLTMSASSLISLAQDSESFFPIMAWSSAPEDPAMLKRMKECGLTIAGFARPSALDAIHAAGLKAIVQDSRCSAFDWKKIDTNKLRENLTSLAGEVNNHPAVFGYYLKDEPVAALFPGLATACQILKEIAPGKWPYINLFPIYVDYEYAGAKDYADYLEKFITTCSPPIISYDHYALMEHEPLRQGYWPNLEAIRAASVKHQISFWNIVLSVAHFNYRVPTEADYRFQAWSTLAYGGRGISYFMYMAPMIGNYRMAPVDQFGHETPTWYYMQSINLQVLKLAPTLLKLTSTRVYHLGEVPENCQGPDKDSLVAPFPSGNFLVGEFKHADGSTYVMIVNKHLTDSFPCDPKFVVITSKVQMVSPYTGALVEYTGEQKWLAAGQGVLLKVD